jgi:hypothetical protein
MSHGDLSNDRPYWARHYGLASGPTDKRAWARLGLAFVVAIALLCLFVVLAALATS